MFTCCNQPDLVLKSKKTAFSDVEEATVCRLCNDIAEDAIQSKCRHIFDRECIKQYLNTAVEQVVRAYYLPIRSTTHLRLSLPAQSAISRSLLTWKPLL